MKTFRVAKKLAPVDLDAALRVAEVDAVTIRAMWAEREDAVAMIGVVVAQDAAPDATVQAVIAAHDPAGTPSRIPTPEEMEAALIQMEKL